MSGNQIHDNHKIAVSLSVEESTDVPLVDSQGADPARA